VRRRALLQAAAALAAGGPWLVRAQQPVPIADMHSHYGMVARRQLAESGFADDMRNNGVVLVAWKLVADGPWLRHTSTGTEPASAPASGALAEFFNRSLARMEAYVREHKLKLVLTRADVDAALARQGPGEVGVVFAAEGADFLEGKLDGLAAAYERGLRHLQLVHVIPSPVGDRQTSAPSHHGLSELGKDILEACNTRGILVDLAHCTGAAVDQALDLSTAAMVWSHGWVEGEGGKWQDQSRFLQRRLSFAHARKIAAKGGVVGLWGFGRARPDPRWEVRQNDQFGYARELAKLVDQIGADHVAIGTDIEGVGTNWAVNTYVHVRAVVEALQAAKLPSSTIEKVAFANYARVLKAALKS
jgi:membrane dipeptidase